MFSARYGLIPYIKQITFRVLKVNISPIEKIFKLVTNRNGAGVILKLLYPDLSVSFTKSGQASARPYSPQRCLADRFPGGAKDFSVLYRVQAVSGGPPNLLLSEQRGAFPVSNEARSCIRPLTQSSAEIINEWS